MMSAAASWRAKIIFHISVAMPSSSSWSEFRFPRARWYPLKKGNQQKKAVLRGNLSQILSHNLCARERVSREEKKDSLLVYLFFVLWRVSSLLPNHHNPFVRSGGGGINWIVDWCGGSLQWREIRHRVLKGNLANARYGCWLLVGRVVLRSAIAIGCNQGELVVHDLWILF